MSRIEEQVIDKIRSRAEVGLNKYGVTLERNDLTIKEWLIHAQEEAMDLSGYLEKVIEIIDQQDKTLRALEIENAQLTSKNMELEAKLAVLISNQN